MTSASTPSTRMRCTPSSTPWLGSSRTQRSAVLTSLTGTEKKYRSDVEYMDHVAKDLVLHRKENPTDKPNLLNAMVKGPDPKSGDVMTDELIMANMITFVIAGPRRMRLSRQSLIIVRPRDNLSIAFLCDTQSPEIESAYRAAQEEIDTVVGRDPVQVQHLKKLDYVNAVLRKTLRISPMVPAMTKQVSPKFQGQATLCKGKYSIGPSDKILALRGATQRDLKVYGDDANEFKPERMLGDDFKNLPDAAWKASPQKIC